MPEQRELVRFSLGEIREVVKIAEGKEDSEFVYIYPAIVVQKARNDYQTSIS